MSELSDDLLCVFSGRIEERDDEYVIRIPDQELNLGPVTVGETYRVALVAAPHASKQSANSKRDGLHPEPPVREGERREVVIEDLGEQGDGIARVERGFVIIVPDTEPGAEPTIEITDVQSSVAFGEVIDTNPDRQTP